MKKRLKSILYLSGASLLVAALVFQALPQRKVHAAGVQITDRKLTLMAGATDGGSKPGGVVNHMFNFTLHVDDNVGSIKFEYCTLAALACVTPTGLVTTNATLGSESGLTGFAMDTDDVPGKPYLTRTPADTNSTTTAVAFRLDGITNPTNENETFFVRITTHSDAAATSAALDEGTVTASTAEPIDLEGTMPESLVFCTGAEVLKTDNLPDCSTATPGDIEFSGLFSPITTATATSQMAASTNAGQGYTITVNGPTLTSGLNTITPIAAAEGAILGKSQFGMNLMANTLLTSNPIVGADIDEESLTPNLRGQALAGYNTVDVFKYASGEAVANSGNPSLSGSDAQIYTASYIVNVPGSQPAGIYTTTLTYICTATF
ncbi:hypothetical protein JNJ66_06455 [Candidatus Saccharibacteria bacterium]|nr:hypothetical protein [Candidatus Saccharibacteria bacterium]